MSLRKQCNKCGSWIHETGECYAGAAYGAEGVALQSMSHPVPADLDPAALETIEIDLPPPTLEQSVAELTRQLATLNKRLRTYLVWIGVPNVDD